MRLNPPAGPGAAAVRRVAAHRLLLPLDRRASQRLAGLPHQLIESLLVHHAVSLSVHVCVVDRAHEIGGFYEELLTI